MIYLDIKNKKTNEKVELIKIHYDDVILLKCLIIEKNKLL